MKILDTKSIQDWETQSIASGIDSLSLMREAVHGLHHFITGRFPVSRALIACGKGNNGNDALWLAHELKKSGWEILPWLTHPEHERSPILGIPEAIHHSLADSMVFPDTPLSWFSSSSPIFMIDGILGLGANGNPRGPAAEMIQWLMQHKRRQDICISLDTPSGLEGTSGELFTPSFQADFTLAIGAVKSGCLKENVSATVGRLSAIPISLTTPGPECDFTFFTIDEARSILTHRPADTYKHQQGTVGIWAGSPGMFGAAILASQAALRSGAGLVRLFTHETLSTEIIAKNPEIMEESLTLSKKLNDKIFDSDCILIGPGIGITPENISLLSELIHQATCPLVIDADGLTLCAKNPELLKALPNGTILTPHHGEFKRLFPENSLTISEVTDDFTSSHPQLTLCLKGPNTLILSKKYGTSYNGSGNPGMATAGSGDVLAGLLAGIRARGLNEWDSTRMAVFWHGLAGDLAAKEVSEDSLTAGDILKALGASRTLISRP